MESIMTLISNTLVSVDTVVPTLSVGQIQVSADRRSTGTNKLTDAQRIRRVVLPAGHWGELKGSLNGEASQSLTDLLRIALVGIANDRLRDVLTENPDTRTVELSAFTVSALLAWNAESAISRGSFTFTREQVEEWFAKSATLAALKEKHAANPKLPALLQLVATRFATLAAKNHGIKEEKDADKLLSLIDSADLDGASASLVVEIVGRLEAIKKAIAKKAAEDSASMDDL